MRPVVVIPPARAARPIVVEVPHAGTHIPDEIRPELALGERGVMGDADLYVDRLYRRATELGATLLYTEISRFVVDLNRAPDDVDRLAVPDHPAPQTDAPRGLIWRVTTEGESVLAQVTSLLLADDEGQREFIVEALRIVGRNYPESLTGALQAVAATHEAPELVEKLQTYLTA